MSYLVLARKYRPRKFAEVTGQEVVTRTLQGAIGEGRIAHAYLFSGPRGTGKTTTARLFAKALNCEAGPAPEPCGECDRCLAADRGAEVDIIEIDAASHTGVENVRELRDQAAYVPLRARHKVYLIDEVHMLSKPAFNALLKTLEEPPPHVKFLFATTEPHKVPDTILSRCQVLKLSALSEADITARLDEVLALEGIQPEPGVTAGLARRARGGMRDALSLADQLLALVGDRPTLADTERLSAGVDRENLARLASRLAAFDRPGVLEELAGHGGGETELVEALLAHFRACLLAAHCGEASPLFEAPAESRAAMAECARELGADRLELVLEELLAARDAMRQLPGQARLILELTLLQLSRPETTLPVAELAERLLALERRLAGAPAGGPAAIAVPPSRPPAPRAAAPPPAEPPAAPRSAAPPPAPPAERRPAPPRAPAAPARSAPNYAGAVQSSTGEAWARFLEELAPRSSSLAQLFEEYGKLIELDERRAVVQFQNLRQADQPLVEDSRNQHLCSRVFSEVMGRKIEVSLEDGAKTRPGREDEFTSQVADLFGGRIEG